MPFTSHKTPRYKRAQSVLLGLVAASSLATSANALSCMRPDIAQTMETAKASDDLYYIMVGQFSFTPLPKKPRSADPNAPLNGVGAHTVKATFNGRFLSNVAEYDAPAMRVPVDIDVSCAGPWCGGPPQNGTEVIAFAKSRPGQPLLLEVGPCPGKVYGFERAKVEKLRNCFDKACTPDIDPRFDRR